MTFSLDRKVGDGKEVYRLKCVNTNLTPLNSKGVIVWNVCQAVAILFAFDNLEKAQKQH